MKRFDRLLFAITIAIFAFSSLTASAQVFQLYSIDATEFPTVKGYFNAKNQLMKDYTGLQTSEFHVTEDGVDMGATLELKCEKVDFYPPIAVYMCLDVSPSMDEEYIPGQGKKIEWVQYAGNAFIDSVKLEDPSVMAINSFSGRIKENIDFTRDKQPLRDFVDMQVILYGATDFNAPFFGPPTGPPPLGAIAALKTQPDNLRKVIVFLTDGMHEDTKAFDYQRVIDECKAALIQVYVISINSWIDIDLDDIAQQTGGKSFRAQSRADLVNVYRLISQEIQNQDICWLEWQAPFGCDDESKNRAVEATFDRNGISSTKDYVAPDNSIVKLVSGETLLLFGKPGIGTTTRTYEISSQGNTTTVNGVSFTPDNGDFQVTDWGGTPPPFTISPGDPNRTITVEYVEDPPTASHSVDLVLQTTPCDSDPVQLIAPCDFEHNETYTFADVPIMTSAQETITCALKNTTAMEISGDAQLAGANADQFTIVAGGGPFTLQPDDCLNLTIQFAPTTDGTKTAEVHFNIDAVCGEAITLLDGKGITTDFPLKNMAWGKRRILTLNDSTYVIENTSQATANILSISLETPGDANFSITPPATPATIDAGGKLEFPISFTPQDEGPYQNAIVVEIENVDDPVSAQLSGVGFLPKLTYPKTTNFGVLTPGDVGPYQNLTLENPSETANTYIHMIELLPVFDYDQFEIDPATNLSDFEIDDYGGVFNIPVRFKPTTSGSKTAYIVVKSDAAPGPEVEPEKIDTLVLTGSGLGLEITPQNIDFGDVLACASKTEIFTVDNSGGAAAINVTSVSVDDDANFSVADYDQTVNAGETGSIRIMFHPQTLGAHSTVVSVETSAGDASLNAIGNGTSTQSQTEITRIIKPANAAIVDNALKAEVGEVLELEFTTDIPDLQDAKVAVMNYRITFNPFMMQYIENSFIPLGTSFPDWDVEQIESGVLNIYASGAQVEPPITLTNKISFNTFLADTNQCILDIEPFFNADCLVPVAANLTLNLQTCNTEGRLVQVNPNELRLYDASPNPATDQVKLKFSVGLDGYTELTVFNYLGLQVKRVMSQSLKNGVYEANVPVSDLPAGVYFYRLTNGPFSKTKSFIISE